MATSTPGLMVLHMKFMMLLSNLTDTGRIFTYSIIQVHRLITRVSQICRWIILQEENLMAVVGVFLRMLLRVFQITAQHFILITVRILYSLYRLVFSLRIFHWVSPVLYPVQL